MHGSHPRLKRLDALVDHLLRLIGHELLVPVLHRGLVLPSIDVRLANAL